MVHYRVSGAFVLCREHDNDLPDLSAVQNVQWAAHHMGKVSIHSACCIQLCLNSCIEPNVAAPQRSATPLQVRRVMLKGSARLFRNTAGWHPRQQVISSLSRPRLSPPKKSLGRHRSMDYSSINTPERCYADFCLIPVCSRPPIPRDGGSTLLARRAGNHFADRVCTKVGTGNVSVANEVAEVQRLLKASGLTYTMHSAGTTVGEFCLVC